VISARSGLVHYFEGAVYVADRPLESHLGKYASIPEGGELRTERGRAEVLLTPGVFLRVGENTTIRMIRNTLADTKVELVSGSAILDSLDAGAGRLCTLVYKTWTLTQTQKGVYRLDSDPPRLVVREGEVDVLADGGGSPVSVLGGMEMPFAAVIAPEKMNGEVHDALNDWADGRAQSVAADNEIAANIQDPATMPASDLLSNNFTYFPMLGIPSYTSPLSVNSLGLYGGSSVYQPGFYSIYLPGYTRPPSFLGLRGIGGLGGVRGIGIGGLSGIGGLGLQHSLTPPSRVFSPVSPVRSPFTHGTPVPSAPHGGAHIGGHR
jgi:hypothetical protein